MYEMGSHDPFGHLKHKSWSKEGSGVKFDNLTPNHKKSGIDPISLCAGGMPHIVEKLSMRTTTLLWTSYQSKVCKESYVPPKSWKSQVWEFRDFDLGVPGQNAFGCGPHGEAESII
jgi:hypothetical protein